MAVSVRMDPLMEKELELAARRQGITKSQFIIAAVERALGRKDPTTLSGARRRTRCLANPLRRCIKERRAVVSVPLTACRAAPLARPGGAADLTALTHPRARAGSGPWSSTGSRRR